MWPQLQLGSILLPTYNLILAIGVLNTTTGDMRAFSLAMAMWEALG